MRHRAHKIRVYPNKAQIIALKKTVGVCRFAYNWGLQRWRELYDRGEKHSAYILSQLWTSERPDWSKEVSTCAPRRALADAQSAYDALFRKKRYRKIPRFRKKGRNDSFYLTNEMAPIRGDRIRLGKVGWARMAEPLRYQASKILSCTVSHKAGKWYVCINCELNDPPINRFKTSIVGVDVGCKHWAVASDGRVLDEPEKLKALRRKLTRKQQQADRKQYHSKNSEKAYQKVSRLFQRIDNIKKDAIHKFTTAITKNHGVVVLETLSVRRMLKASGGRKKAIAKGVSNACMREIQRQLIYKADRYLLVDRFFPSSKTCSHCGCVNDALTLSDRTYHCPSCGHTIDRDLNAALNIRKEGERKLSTVGHTVKDCGVCARN